MSAVQANNSTSAWTEPPWSGWIETTGDALLILEAARRGLIPRVTRRLVDTERKMITSGSVFVFDEDESGIKRWTDGFYWSPSRILGNFLLYRETDKRSAVHRGPKSDAPPSDANAMDGAKAEGSSLSRPKTDSGHVGVDKQLERNLLGSLTNSYKFKADGLMKKVRLLPPPPIDCGLNSSRQTFSLTIGGVAQHLISYYKIEDVTNGRLRSPSSLPELASLDISPEYLDKGHFRNPPKVEIGIDGRPRYRGEADDIDTSPALLTTPFSSALTLPTPVRTAESSNTINRAKRFEPYTPSTKRSRRPAKSDSEESPTSAPGEQPKDLPTSSHSGTNSAPSPLPPPPYPTPYPPHFYHMPPYLQPPHVFYPPATTSPVPPVPNPGFQSQAPLVTDTQQSASQDASPLPQPYYPYPPPQVAGYPPGYTNTWPPYVMYPSHVPPLFSAAQPSSTVAGDLQGGISAVEGAPT